MMLLSMNSSGNIVQTLYVSSVLTKKIFLFKFKDLGHKQSFCKKNKKYEKYFPNFKHNKKCWVQFIEPFIDIYSYL